MSIKDLIDQLSPFKTGERVDILIQLMKENNIELTPDVDMLIRNAIKKMRVQVYYVKTYGCHVINDKTKEESNRLLKRKKQEKLKIEEEQLKRMRYVNSKDEEAFENKIKKRKKEKKWHHVPSSAPSALRTFGSAFSSVRKKNKRSKSRKNSQKKDYPIETTNSIRTISVPMGGMNKW